MFFGLDLHKKFLQVAAVDQDGNLLMSKRAENDFKIIEQKSPALPKNAKYVSELSSVRYGVYRKLVGDLGLDVVLSNPYLGCLIAKSKKKTDRFDAHALADCSGEDIFVRPMSCLQKLLMKSRRYAFVQEWCRAEPD